MPLSTLANALHIRVTCDTCRCRTAEVCARRELEVTAVVQATTKFLNAGWHLDAVAKPPLWDVHRAARAGQGRWYCPECARNTGH